MTRWKWSFAARLLVFGLPYALLMVFGCLWLYEHRYFYHFACAAAVLAVVGWFLIRWINSTLQKRRSSPSPVNTWPPAGERAWKKVDAIAARTEACPPPFNDANGWTALFREIFDVVAREFYSKSAQPELEVTATDALRVVELVAGDLRRFLTEQVPGSDQITIHSFQKIIQWWPIASQLFSGVYNVYRLARLAFSPQSALINEAQSAFVGGSTSNLLADLPKLAAGFYVRQTGCYAIQLYSGQITLSDPEFADLGADKPLRVLVLGQTKAGKSSLINALFGEVRAATDVLPCTDAITQYIFARPGLPNAIVFDTIGFAGKGDKAAIKKLDEELAQCDLVIAVCSANMAARDPDRKLLDQARLRFSANLKRAAPPIVVALSHVDKVRPFNEWNPPYNFIDGQSPKERNVGDAIGEVAKDLQVHRDSIMPVYLRQNRVYNVEEGLLPLIARILPAGERAKLLRILMESRTAEQRESLKRQLVNAGFSAIQLAAYLAKRKLGQRS